MLDENLPVASVINYQNYHDCELYGVVIENEELNNYIQEIPVNQMVIINPSYRREHCLIYIIKDIGNYIHIYIFVFFMLFFLFIAIL
tara:strand:- start:64 stop:324 length:261 start_codon:yes stop_codon:yes gene_type:complete